VEEGVSGISGNAATTQQQQLRLHLSLLSQDRRQPGEYPALDVLASQHRFRLLARIVDMVKGHQLVMRSDVRGVDAVLGASEALNELEDVRVRLLVWEFSFAKRVAQASAARGGRSVYGSSDELARALRGGFHSFSEWLMRNCRRLCESKLLRDVDADFGYLSSSLPERPDAVALQLLATACDINLRWLQLHSDKLFEGAPLLDHVDALAPAGAGTVLVCVTLPDDGLPASTARMWLPFDYSMAQVCQMVESFAGYQLGTILRLRQRGIPDALPRHTCVGELYVAVRENLEVVFALSGGAPGDTASSPVGAAAGRSRGAKSGVGGGVDGPLWLGISRALLHCKDVHAHPIVAALDASHKAAYDAAVGPGRMRAFKEAYDFVNVGIVAAAKRAIPDWFAQNSERAVFSATAKDASGAKSTRGP
jgi:hypothetical protein